MSFTIDIQSNNYGPNYDFDMVNTMANDGFDTFFNGQTIPFNIYPTDPTSQMILNFG